MAVNPPITIEVSELTNRSSTWSHVFQGKNTTWPDSVGQDTLGNFFLGLQGQVQAHFNTQIPPGVTILSAEFEATPNVTNLSDPFDTLINAPARGLETQQQDAIQTPFEPWTGYRQDLWSNAQVGALSTTFTAVFGTSVTTNANWTLRPDVAPGATLPMRDRLAQRITTRTGNMEIATLLWDLSRLGVPPGDIRVSIQGVTNDRGVDIPDGIDQGAGPSDGLLASTVPLVQTVQGFSWSGANPVLVPLTDYFILLEVDYPASATDNILSWHQNAFAIAGGGQLRHYGEGLGMDWQNFPGTVDLNQVYQGSLVAPDTLWPIGGSTAGVPEISPDISALVQAQIDQDNYTIESGIAVALSRILPTAANRRFRSNANVANTPYVLRITYQLVDDKLADPASRFGRHRIIEPWDDRYYRFKYGKDKPEPVELVEERVGTWTGESEADIERPAVMAEMLDQDRLDAYDARNAQNERDIAELEAYILAGTQALAQDVGMAEAEIEDQEAFIAQLETNIVMARDALIAALDSRRKHQNLLAAIEAVIRNYY